MAESSLKTFGRAFTDIFFPRFCIACNSPVQEDNPIDVCQKCLRLMALPEVRYCPKCSAAMARFASKCPNCHNMRLAMNESAAFGIYRGSLREALVALKFQNQRYLARTFGGLVAVAVRRRWERVTFDAVTGAALFRGRRRERGFDQARAIAQHAAKALRLPYRPRLLRRVRATESQVGLSKTARVRNLKGAFLARPGGSLKTVLVVDDIMTTGATVSEAARALKKAGVKEVYAAVVARAALSDVVDANEPSLTKERLPA